MRSLIKMEGAMEFLTEDGSWTKDVAKARVFPSVTDVHETQKKLGLKGVEHYVLQREQVSSLDFSFPLG